MKKDAQYRVIAELIHGFLEEIEIVGNEKRLTEDEILDKLQENEFARNGITSQQLGYENGTDYAVFVPYNSQKTAKELLASVINEPLDDGDPITIHVVMMVSTMEELLKLKEKTKKDEIVREVKSWAKKRKKSPINYRAMHCPDRKEKSFSISISSRIRALHYPVSSTGNTTIESDVYIAKLFDLVELYNEVGEELFSRNVRYHIKDVLDVESEIKKTLENNPIEFYNFNNGIAMQITDTERIDRRNESDIRLEYKDRLVFSVINGAQTISAAAEYFYRQITEDEDGRKQEALDLAKKETYVLLRVFYPPKELKKADESAFGNITVSLNRQKPINAVDVGYNCEEVFRINALCAQEPENPYYFKLLKRGQVGSGKFRYQLSEFGRLVTAYYHGEPGKARSKSTADIVWHKQNDEANSSEKKTIYADFLQEKSDSDVFMQWYKPLNFAYALSQLYIAADKEGRNKEGIDGNACSVLSYGRYFFIAYVINTLCPQTRTKGSDVDFSSFAYDASIVTKNAMKLKEHIIEFVKSVSKFGPEFMKESNSAQTVLDSNVFKKEDIYTKWCAYAKENSEVKQWKEELKQILNNCKQCKL